MNMIFAKGEVMRLDGMIAYAEGGVVSKQVLKSNAGNITLFAFDKGQGLSEHTAPFDAFVQVLDGVVDITLGGNVIRLTAGESVIMPANVAHALSAVEPFKMLLTMIRG